MTVDMLTTFHDLKLQNDFSSVYEPMSPGTDTLLQTWSNLQVCFFLVFFFPFAMIRQVPIKLMSPQGVEMTLTLSLTEMRLESKQL